jgi:hypothetical protein
MHTEYKYREVAGVDEAHGEGVALGQADIEGVAMLAVLGAPPMSIVLSDPSIRRTRTEKSPE